MDDPQDQWRCPVCACTATSDYFHRHWSSNAHMLALATLHHNEATAIMAIRDLLQQLVDKGATVPDNEKALTGHWCPQCTYHFRTGEHFGSPEHSRIHDAALAERNQQR